MIIKVFFDKSSDADKVAERLEIKKDRDCSVVVENKETAKNALEKEKISHTTYSISEAE